MESYIGTISKLSDPCPIIDSSYTLKESPDKRYKIYINEDRKSRVFIHDKKLNIWFYAEGSSYKLPEYVNKIEKTGPDTGHYYIKFNDGYSNFTEELQRVVKEFTEKQR